MSDAAARPTVPGVSVVIPVMDNADTVGEAIDSVLDQVPAPIEILVIDDGSTDASGATAAAKGDPVRVIRQENQGIGGARNRGIREAGGDVIAFLDADDRWLPHKLERQLALLRPEVDIVGGWVAQIPEDAWKMTLENGAPRATWMSGPIASSVLVRRSVFARIGLFGDYRAGEFIDWFARAQAAGIGIASVEDLVLLRRIHSHNYGTVHRDVYADSYLAVVRAALARRNAAGPREGKSS